MSKPLSFVDLMQRTSPETTTPAEAGAEINQREGVTSAVSKHNTHTAMSFTDSEPEGKTDGHDEYVCAPALPDEFEAYDMLGQILKINAAEARDFVTVVRVRPGVRAAKEWISLDEMVDYGDILWVKVVEERPVNSILDLSALIQEIEPDPSLLLIRGRLRPDWEQIQELNLPAWTEKRRKDDEANAKKENRPVKYRKPLVPPGPGWVLRRKALFEDVPHHWALFDSDKFRPTTDPLRDPEGAALEYAALLPSEFQDTSMHLQLSNSAGLTSTAGLFKAHVWYWFEKAYTGAQLKAWAEATWPDKDERKLRVDTVVFECIQIHYTSRPVMGVGVSDPVPKRSFFLDGACLGGDEVALQMPTVALAAKATEVAASDLVDPRTKAGVQGAYCRAFELETILADHIPGVFEWASDTRLTWLGGGGAAEGAFVREDRQGIGASHNSWPWGTNRVVNNWDLVRHFKFGHLDASEDDLEAAVLRNSAPQHLPSHAAMREWAKALPEVQAELPDDDPHKIVTARSVIERLRAMSRDDVLAKWAALCVPLTRGAAEEVIGEVSRLSGVGLRALKAELTEARAAVKRELNRAAARARIGTRKIIEYRPEDKSDIAAELERAVLAQVEPGEYVSFGGLLAHVTTKRLPYTHLVDDTGGEAPVVAQIEPMDDVAVLAKAERAVAFCETRDGVPQLIGVPTGVIDILLKKKSHAAPQVTGLVTHPIVLRDGEVLAADGLHARSGLFLQGASCPGARPYTQDEAREAFARVRRELLDGFEFASDLDTDAAVAGLFTGVQRRLVDMAPGLAVVAGAQSSGKTTLARRIHVILTGQDMPVSTFPQGDEAEVQKRLLSMLLRSPAMVCFDNIGDGTTFRSGALAAAMTGPVLSQRVLGMSRDADCLTNVLFVITGNNLSLGADEATRWMLARLAPKCSRPEERVFANPDVVGHAMSVRAAVLRDVVGIVAGYLASGETMTTQTRFAHWDRMVRQPLLWAGASDLAQCFKANTANSEDLLAHQGLMQILWEVFGDSKFKARDVAQIAAQRWEPFASSDSADLERLMLNGRSEAQAKELAAELESVLANLRAKDAHSERSVGRVLKSKVDRVAQVKTGEAECGMALASSPSRGLLVFRIERRD